MIIKYRLSCPNRSSPPSPAGSFVTFFSRVDVVVVGVLKRQMQNREDPHHLLTVRPSVQRRLSQDEVLAGDVFALVREHQVQTRCLVYSFRYLGVRRRRVWIWVLPLFF